MPTRVRVLPRTLPAMSCPPSYPIKVVQDGDVGDPARPARPNGHSGRPTAGSHLETFDPAKPQRDLAGKRSTRAAFCLEPADPSFFSFRPRRGKSPLRRDVLGHVRTRLLTAMPKPFSMSSRTFFTMPRARNRM